MRERHLIGSSWLASVLAALVLGGVLGSSDIATAQVTVSGPTVTATDGLCMQRIFIGDDTTAVNNDNALNCTAEDIKISAVESAFCTGPNCISSTECAATQNFTLDARFGLSVTSNARYDASFFFRTDGTSVITTVKGKPQESGAYGGTQNNQDGSGECSLSWLTNPPPANGPVLNLDSDQCGDLNSGNYTGSQAVRFLIPNVTCTSTANDGFVHLPYCTSWHSNQGTQCSTVASVNPDDDPNKFTHNPDTKSKCTCGDLKLPIQVRTPTGTVAKVATQALVTYQVTVTNTSGFAVNITGLSDNIYGNIADGTNSAIDSTTCAMPQNGIANNGTYQCTFVVKHLKHPVSAQDDVTNVVTAQLKDPQTNNTVPSGTGTTRVTLQLNAPPAP